MFGVGFSHQGERCTFETLATHFGLTQPGVVRIGQIVHDLDIKDGRFAAPDAAASTCLLQMQLVAEPT